MHFKEVLFKAAPKTHVPNGINGQPTQNLSKAFMVRFLSGMFHECVLENRHPENTPEMPKKHNAFFSAKQSELWGVPPLCTQLD